MTGKKAYLQPTDMILRAICDLCELQHGIREVSDAAHGVIRYRVALYANEWEYRFEVSDIGYCRSMVGISIAKDVEDKHRLIEHEFAMLDYMLLDQARIDYEAMEADSDAFYIS